MKRYDLINITSNPVKNRAKKGVQKDALSFFNGFKPLFRTTFQDILLWS